MKQKRYIAAEAVWYLIIFAFFYIWFTQVHPLVVYDVDDWTYLSYIREALPIWGEWNPAKVFPEVALPFVSTIALYTLYPLTGDYLGTFTVAHAFVVSVFLTGYFWCFGQLLKRIFSMSRLSAGMLTALFLLLHFLVFRVDMEANLYMFHCVDLNCYYNYLIPALMGASTLMHMMGNGKFDAFMRSDRYTLKGVVWVWLYFTIFSNLTTSGILAAYAGSVLLLGLLKRRKKFRIGAYVRDYAVYLMILLGWFVSAVFELSGGRAGTAAGSASLQENAKLTFYFLKEILVQKCSPVFWGGTILIVLVTGVLLVRSKGKGSGEEKFLPGFTVLMVAGAAMLVYTVLLCVMVNPETVFRAEYLFGVFFYGLLIVLLAAAYILEKYPKAAVVLPFVLVVLLSVINTQGNTFHESNKYNTDPDTCAAISRDILDQILTAEEAGQKEMVLYVPWNVPDPENEDNWPHTLILMHRVSGALYEQGILKRQIYIVDVQASAQMNERYGLPIP